MGLQLQQPRRKWNDVICTLVFYEPKVSRVKENCIRNENICVISERQFHFHIISHRSLQSSGPGSEEVYRKYSFPFFLT